MKISNYVKDIFNCHVSHFNPDRYWKFREICCDPSSRFPLIVKYFFLYRIKKSEAYNCASLGARVNGGSLFKSQPFLPHGIKGIFITDRAIIGSNVTIYQQVTIGVKDPFEATSGPTIGDNCIIGAGAKIIGKITIGNNVKIGAGCIIATDIPDGCTVVMNKP